MPITTNEAEPSSSPFKKSDSHFLEYKSQLLHRGDVLIHQDTDGDSQRLGADIACHVEDHRLEADKKGDTVNDRFENTDYRGNAHAEEEQQHQPRETFFKLCNSGSCRSSSEVRPASFA